MKGSKGFRQLDPIEAAIAAAWLEARAAAFHSVAFNVHVGPVPQAPPWANAATARQLAASARRRADAMVIQAGVLTLVEIKAHVRFSTYRQLTDYRRLYAEAHPRDPRPRGLLLGRTVQPGLAQMLEGSPVRLEIFPVNLPDRRQA